METLDAVAPILARDRSASIQAIADRSGVSRATLTRMFPTRQALVRATAEKILADCATVLDEVEKSENALSVLVRDHVPFAQLWSVVYIEPDVLGDPELTGRADKVLERVTAFVAKAQRANVFRQDMPATWLAATFCGLADTAWNLVLEGWMGPRQSAGFVESMLLHGGGAR